VELYPLLREAIELQVMEVDAEASARTLQTAIMEFGAVDVGDLLLDGAGFALRRMVEQTDTALSAPDLLSRLMLDGAVPEERIDLLTDTLLMAAATAGGIRPSVEALITKEGAQDAMFGLWLGLLTTMKIVSLVTESSEAEVAEDVLAGLET
jgi:hypothetical protein